ncbi:cytochrome c [Ectobacillus sp. JY-23]|uniref:cytochrome c550 n=1 Tax=Ectobacillus sp. JY-23 TaxID=2933872 RepID=UPI001FF30313|nr:cytochrome c [Ectobacillus sp. JY-23]UOY94037.1 cytochrome c [Ectobacillus sp. JY-23]
MKRNPLIPFALIAVLGILSMFLLSFQGLHKADELAAAQKNGGKATQAASKPEDIVKQSCTSCHGEQLQGGVGPNISKIGSKLSKDDIQNVILNGKGNMPPGLLPADQAAKVADYLAKKK